MAATTAAQRPVLAASRWTTNRHSSRPARLQPLGQVSPFHSQSEFLPSALRLSVKGEGRSPPSGLPDWQLGWKLAFNEQRNGRSDLWPCKGEGASNLVMPRAWNQDPPHVITGLCRRVDVCVDER